MACLDELIGADHRARVAWAYVQGLDLSALYAEVRSYEDGPGAAQTDPAVLAALWLYATLEGVGSARHVARLCETDAAYRWILGGISTNHHTLSDFRTRAGEALDRALSASIASLAQAGLILLEEIDKGGPSASATDADARIMRMADSGFRPAYNIQVAGETKTGLVIAVEPITGGDKGRLGATVEALVEAYGERPKRLLADGGYNSKTDIAARGREGVEVYCPLPATDRPRKSEEDEIVRWRARMQSQEGRAVHARRLPSERPHADMRNRGLTQFLVRGLAKVKSVALWFAHAHNALIWQRLTAQA